MHRGIVITASLVATAAIIFAVRALPSDQAVGRATLPIVNQLVPEDDSGATGSALYGRQRAQRRAVVAMREDLRKLVTAESTFFADSGRYTAWLPAGYQFPLNPGTYQLIIRLSPNGWWASMGSLHTGIECFVAVGPDTTFGGQPSGIPWCRGYVEPTSRP